MKNIKLTILATIILAFGIVSINAQETNPNEETRPNVNRQERPNLMSYLGLSKEQVQQVRKIKQANREGIQQAERNQRLAKKELDEAVYNDNFDENDVQNKLRNFQIAQAELVKLRTADELAIRKVLTPEQLVKFREFRQRFMQRPMQNPNKENQPIRPIRQNMQKRKIVG
jgi:Spy/CpxP family protein refolding chaperone